MLEKNVTWALLLRQIRHVLLTESNNLIVLLFHYCYIERIITSPQEKRLNAATHPLVLESQLLIFLFGFVLPIIFIIMMENPLENDMMSLENPLDNYIILENDPFSPYQTAEPDLTQLCGWIHTHLHSMIQCISFFTMALSSNNHQ